MVSIRALRRAMISCVVHVRAISSRTIWTRVIRSVVRIRAFGATMIGCMVPVRSVRPQMIGSMIHVSATGRMLIIAVVVTRRRSSP
jgi:hypothetical protein